MATERANDLHAFKSFIEKQLAGETVPTMDEVLARQENENESADEREETLEAIRRGLADVEAGRVRPAREAVFGLRRKHNQRKTEFTYRLGREEHRKFSEFRRPLETIGRGLHSIEYGRCEG